MGEQGMSLSELKASQVNLALSANARYVCLDALRGFALLGILMMNAIAFAYPEIVYSNPFAAGPLSNADKLHWFLSELLFAEKFYALFAMLFGAGILLMAERAGDEQQARRLHYRRMFWLLMIGMLHGYLVWWGDILVTYAIAGMIIYPCRYWRVRNLWILAVALQFAISLLYLLMYWGGSGMSPDELTETYLTFFPPASELTAEINANRGTWWEQASYRVASTVEYQTSYLIPLLVRMSGIMLMGMALFKTSVLLAARSSRFYIIHLSLSLPTGWVLSATGAWLIVSTEFALPDSFSINRLWNLWGALFTAWGYTCVFMLFARQLEYRGESIGAAITSRLAPVGQMALTNYLMQSILCSLVFYGWGFGLYASLSRWQVTAVVVIIWVAQITWSRWWLARFYYGPAEWAWRSATQRRRQAWRR